MSSVIASSSGGASRAITVDTLRSALRAYRGIGMENQLQGPKRYPTRVAMLVTEWAWRIN